jgi:hypothetical protein
MNNKLILIISASLLSVGFMPAGPLFRNGNKIVTSNLVTNLDAVGASASMTPYAAGFSSSTWKDLSGHSNNGTLSGTLTGWVGTGTTSSPYAYSLNGSSDKMGVGAILTGMTQAAIEAWVKPGSTSAAGTVLVSNGTAATGTTNAGLTIRQSSNPIGRYVLAVGKKYYSYRDLVLSDNPSGGYWRLDEASGTTAVDSSAAGNTGTYQASPTLAQTSALVSTDPNAGTSITLNGSSQYVSTATAVSNPQVFSLEIWFKTTTTAGGTLIGFGTAQTGTNSSFDRFIYMDNSGYVHFGVCGTNNCSPGGSYATASPYNDGAWHQAVLTFSSVGGGTVLGYMDGGLVSGNVSNIGSAQSYTGYWKIGFDTLTTWPSAPSSFFFQGSLDEAAVYYSVLTSSQILNHYQTGSTGKYKPYPGNSVLADNPTAYWRLGESSGLTAYDLSGNANNGTYTSGVTLGTTSGVLTGDLDTAATLDGSSGYVTLPGSIMASAASVEVWFKTTSSSGQVIMSAQNAAYGSTPTSYSPIIYVGNDGKLKGQLQFIGIGSSVGSTSAVNDGNWHQAVIVGSTASQTFYLDGVSIGTLGSGASISGQTVAYLGIGYSNNNWYYLAASASWNFFNGAIDEASVYNYPLSATQVANHYNSGKGPSWWLCQSKTPISTSNWNLLDAIYNGTTASLIVNGQPECTMTPGTTYGSSGALTVGSDNAGTAGTYWSGMVAWFRTFVANSGSVLTSALAWRNFSTNADRFRTTPVNGIATGGLILHLDAANAFDGTAAPPTGCAAANLNWMDLSSAFLNHTLFLSSSSCSSSLGWVGDGTTTSPYRLVFDGSSIVKSVDTGVAGPSTISMEAWVRHEGVGGTTRRVFQTGSEANGFIIYAQGVSGNWTIGYGGSNKVTGVAVTYNTWLHLVATIIGTTANFYVNGTLVSTVSGNAYNPTAPNGGYLMGNGWLGSVAVVRVYNRILAASEVIKNCNAQVVRFPGVTCALP